MEKHTNTIPSITAKIDLKTDFGTGAKSQRWTIGKPGDDVSGAIYLPKDQKLPTEITIGFLAGSKEHETMKEEKE